MKILAIRGCNLASLRGAFEVDLQDPALADGGLFSIGGPTGSGKSTLLDAMCLALYGRTPRMAGGARIHIQDADQAVTANDPRLLMTRGCADAWAECDFLGQDGHQHRARWSVRRARNRPSGRLQQAERAFGPLAEGEPLGGKRREVEEAVVTAIGLDFEQFCRTVLLAQGQFAAFLAAPAQERARLLETMTGTQLYGQISQYVYERAEEIQASVKGLRSQLDQLDEVDPEQVTTTATALGEEQERVQKLRQQLATIERVLQWQQDLDRLKESADQTAERARQLFADWRLTFGLEEQAADATVLEIGTAACEQSELVVQQLRTLRHQEADLHRQLSEQQADLVDRQDNMKRAAERISLLEEQAEEHRTWLASHSTDASLAQRWTDVHPQLERVAEEISNGLSAAAEIQQLNLALEGSAATRPQCEVDAADLGDHADGSLQDLDGVISELRTAIDACAGRKRQAEAWSKALEHRQHIGARLEKDQQGLRQAELQHHTVEQELAAARAVAEERRRLREDLRLRASFEEHRVQLRSGEPCPLCGATDHPWGPKGEPPPGGVSEEEWQQAEEHARQCEQAAMEADRHLARWRTRLEERQEEWASAEQALRLAVDAATGLGLDPEHSPARNLEQIEDELGRLTAAAELHRCWYRYRVALAEWDQQRLAWQTRLAAVEEQASAVEQRKQAAARKVEEHGLNVDWTSFEADPAGWIERSDRRVAAVLRRTTALTQLEEEGQKAVAEQSSARAALREVQASHSKGTQRLAALSKDLRAAEQELSDCSFGLGYEDLNAGMERLRNADEERRRGQEAWQRHSHNRPSQISCETPEQEKSNLEQQLVGHDARVKELNIALDRLRRSQQQREELKKRIEDATGDGRHWLDLDEVIGSANGSKFRDFAQSLNLDQLLHEANAVLTTLCPRYRLQRIESAHLDLQICDLDMGGELRSVPSLSGGETFQVSLALALGLASMTGAHHLLDTLFLDEGFGTLDPETLDTALAVLDQLQADGRVIGVISHVEEIGERIPHRVEVLPTGSGFSRLRCSW